MVKGLKAVVLTLGFGLIMGVSAQNVGVGTTSPVARLHVEVPNGFSGPSFQVNVTGSSVPQMVILADGKVGIGVSNPQEVVDISGNVRFSGALMPGGDPGAAGQVLVSQGSGVSPQWQVLSGDDWGGQVAVTQVPIVGDGTGSNPIGLQSGLTSGDILVWDGSQWVIQQPGPSSGIAPLCNNPSLNYLHKWVGNELCNSQVYDDGTSVGIGVTNPTAKLDVSGDLRIRVVNNVVSPLNNTYRVLVSDGNGLVGGITFSGNSGQVLLGDGTWGNFSGGDNWGGQVAITQGAIIGDGTSGNPIRLRNGSVSGDILVWNGSQWVVQQPVSSGGVNTCASVGVNYVQKWTGSQLCNSVIYDDGTNVGIGITTPTSKLHVAGNLEINGDFRPGGNSGTAGQILVSQGANSPPQWQTPIPQWYLWAVDFFADATNFQGWSVTGGTNAISTCGNVYLLGGYGNCGSGCSMSKTFSNLPPHSQVMVEIFWWSLDSWDQSGSSTDYVELWIDGNYVTTALPPLPYGILASTTNANNNRKTDQSYCGGAAEIDQGPLSFMTVTNHTASTLTVQVKCMVDQPATDESCGLQAVRVYIK